jgi:GT2 family glycosyltransferase
MTDPLVVAVVLNWNNPKDTVDCVASLNASTYPNLSILLVDNGSTDDSVNLFKERFPELELIETGENLGYAGGNNVGIRHAISQGAEYVFLVNNDVIVAPETVSRLVSATEGNESVGAAGALVFWRDEPEKLYAAYGVVNFSEAIVKLVGRNSSSPDRFSEQMEVDWVIGCAILLGRKTLEDVGELDERFFAYHDEVDWCTRARKKGYRIVLVPGARVWHAGQSSTGGEKYASAKRYFVGRNSVLFARKHATTWQWAKFMAMFFASLPLAFLRELPRGQARGVALKLWGFCDGVRDRKPPLTRLGLR